MPKIALNPESLSAPFGIFSNVTLARPGRLCFVSGQVAVNAEGTVVGKGDVRAQTHQVLKNIEAALGAVGGTIDDIACVNVFLVDMAHLGIVHEVRAEYWKDNYPASTLVQVAGLVDADFLIEISAIAIVE